MLASILFMSAAAGVFLSRYAKALSLAVCMVPIAALGATAANLFLEISCPDTILAFSVSVATIQLSFLVAAALRYTERNRRVYRNAPFF